MITHLKICGLHRYIETTFVQNACEGKKMKDSLALLQIHKKIDILVFEKIAITDMANKAWDILKKTYKRIDGVQQNNLIVNGKVRIY